MSAFGAPSQRIHFQGTLGVLGGKKSLFEEQEFDVLADNDGVVPVGGWPKIAKVARPQAVSVTVLEGWDPIELAIAVIFLSGPDREDVELNIQKLEWMAGRGILFKGKPGHPGKAPLPSIRIWSEDGHGHEVPLVPKQYQTKGLRWKVTDIAINKDVDRARSAHRTRQPVVITVLQDESSPTSASAVQRAALRGSVKGKFAEVEVGQGERTISQIAAALVKTPAERASLTKAIINANKSNRKIGTNPEKQLPLHLRVKVPLEPLAESLV